MVDGGWVLNSVEIYIINDVAAQIPDAPMPMMIMSITLFNTCVFWWGFYAKTCAIHGDRRLCWAYPTFPWIYSMRISLCAWVTSYKVCGWGLSVGTEFTSQPPSIGALRGALGGKYNTQFRSASDLRRRLNLLLTRASSNLEFYLQDIVFSFVWLTAPLKLVFSA